MPSVKQRQREAFRQQAKESHEKKIHEEELKKVMGFSCMLLVLDNYVLKKDDFKITLIAYKNLFSKEFEAKHIYDLVEPVGQWMCKLPKGVWEEKQ